jgi:hypothetical protein
MDWDYSTTTLHAAAGGSDARVWRRAPLEALEQALKVRNETRTATHEPWQQAASTATVRGTEVVVS